jgi:hypothetical protein
MHTIGQTSAEKGGIDQTHFIRGLEMPTLAEVRREAITRLKAEFPWFEQPSIPASVAGSKIEVAVIVDPADRFAIIEADVAMLRGIAQVIAATGERQIADASRVDLDRVEIELLAQTAKAPTSA